MQFPPICYSYDICSSKSDIIAITYVWGGLLLAGSLYTTDINKCVGNGQMDHPSYHLLISIRVSLREKNEYSPVPVWTIRSETTTRM